MFLRNEVLTELKNTSFRRLVKFEIVFCSFSLPDFLERNSRFPYFLSSFFFFFFSVWSFFHEHSSRFIEQQEKWNAISLTPLYHFHSFHRLLDIMLIIKTILLTKCFNGLFHFLWYFDFMEIIFCGKSQNLQNPQNIICTKIYAPLKVSYSSFSWIYQITWNLQTKVNFGFRGIP